MAVQRTGASRHAEWRCGRRRGLAPVADLEIMTTESPVQMPTWIRERFPPGLGICAAHSGRVPRGRFIQGGAPRKLGACPGLSSFAPLGLGRIHAVESEGSFTRSRGAAEKGPLYGSRGTHLLVNGRRRQMLGPQHSAGSAAPREILTAWIRLRMPNNVGLGSGPVPQQTGHPSCSSCPNPAALHPVILGAGGRHGLC